MHKNLIIVFVFFFLTVLAQFIFFFFLLNEVITCRIISILSKRILFLALF